MNQILIDKFKVSAKSLLPIIVIVMILNFTIAPMPFGVRGLFLTGSIFLIIGMALFTLGADLAVMPIGEHLGQYLSNSKKLWLVIITGLLMGTMVTIAEPDLQILAKQIPGIPLYVMMISVAVSLGLFLVIGILRVLFKISLAKLLTILYVGVMILGIFVPKEYLSAAFDAGAVATGPFAIPFILARGVGISASRSGGSTSGNSFGFVALCSIGPIYAIMILSFFFEAKQPDLGSGELVTISTATELANAFLSALPKLMSQIALSIAPLILLFLVFQIVALRLPAKVLIKIGVGLAYTYFGLVIFLAGVSVGFMPAGEFIGSYLGSLDIKWVLIPLGLIMGFVIVLAEPEVHVLIEEVESLSGGAIPKVVMIRAFSISVALSVLLAMVRVLTSISIWWIILPGYAIALILTRYSSKIFTAVAFDAGAVASGPLTATFLLPFAMGACRAFGGNVMMDAFGIVAFVAMTPLLTVQIVGLIYKRKVREIEKKEHDILENITQHIGEHEIGERWGYAEYSDSSSRFDADMDMEFVASPEWVEEVKSDEILHKIMEDNHYIDFDEIEQKIKGEIKKDIKNE